MKVGDKVIFHSNHYYRDLIEGYTYTISEINRIDDAYIEIPNEDYIIVLLENTYVFLSDFITIKEYRKLKLKEIDESR